MKFDGHRIKNGVKFCSTTETIFTRSNKKCTPEKIQVDKKFELPLELLALNDFRKALNHYRLTKWTYQKFDERDMEHIYMLSQGNWNLAQDHMKFYTADSLW